MIKFVPIENSISIVFEAHGQKSLGGKRYFADFVSLKPAKLHDFT